jgi:hypothetical protein
MKVFSILLASIIVSSGFTMAFGQEAPTPFVCTNEALLVQGPAGGDTTLSSVNQSISPFVLTDIANTGVDEINAIGYNDLDNFLYGVQGQFDAPTPFPGSNTGIVQIDANGVVSSAVIPVHATNPDTIAWPTDHTFNTGDVKPGTNTMYLQLNGGAFDNTKNDLYVVDLSLWPSPTFTIVTYSGPTITPGDVLLDWAAHPDPTIPMLFGADRQGQVGMLNTNTGVRTDTGGLGLAGGLPGSDGYGAAWFNAVGDLFVYQNSGKIYQIDLGTNPTDSSDWQLISVQTGEATTRNDGAACVGDAPEPFVCTDYPIIVKRADSTVGPVGLFMGQYDEAPNPDEVDLIAIQDPLGAEYNNIGFYAGFVYATKIQGNGFGDGLLSISKIGQNGVVVDLGLPAGFPTGDGTRFDAGDVTPEGIMFVTIGVASPNVNTDYEKILYAIDLNNSPLTYYEIPITGDFPQINDWAYNPIDGMLYGGVKSSATNSNLAWLALVDNDADPEYDEAQISSAPILPTEGDNIAFGAAWYDSNKNTVFVYQNDGPIFEVDVTDVDGAGPVLVNTWTPDPGDRLYRNDATFCPDSTANPSLTIEKSTNGEDADSPTGPQIIVGETATFTYEVSNTGNVPLSNISVVDDNGTPGDTADDFNPASGFNIGDTNQDNLLDTDETWQYTASTTVTAGQYTNIATADSDESEPANDPSNHFGADASIAIEKHTNDVDADSAPLEGWQFSVDGQFYYTTANLALLPGHYEFIESQSTIDNWMHTTPSTVQITLTEPIEIQFGNVCLGDGGGNTPGFWASKNGKDLYDESDRIELDTLYLVKDDGTPFDLTDDNTNTSHRELRNWLTSDSDAVNMSYMLSVQLAAMKLNVLNGFVNGEEIYHPELEVKTINDLISEADDLLYSHPETLSGNDFRALLEWYKDALDDANNNLNFIQGPSDCEFSFDSQDNSDNSGPTDKEKGPKGNGKNK